MLEWMLAVLTMLLLIAGIPIHELGHALACRSAGIQVKEICLLGWPLPRVPHLTLPIKSLWFPDARWVVHPLVVGAYMVPDEGQMNNASRAQRLTIYAMGPIASVLYGLAFFAASYAVAALIWDGYWNCIYAARCVVAAISIYWLRKTKILLVVLMLCGFFLTAAFFVYFGSAILSLINTTKSFREIFPGPFALTWSLRQSITAYMEMSEYPIAQPITIVCYLVGWYSSLIGLFNMAPFFAGDGTMIVMEFVPVRVAKWIWITTIGVVFGLLFLGLVGDLIWVWNRLQ
jgi:membrane-associated protease RseP (regulator of RpoE activity)